MDPRFMHTFAIRNFAIKLMAAFACAAILSACTTVPKEVVEMSYVVGEDMAALHQSHKALIAEHYKSLRVQRERYLQERWIPFYLSSWIGKGRLVDIAQGKVVWSSEKRTFVPPTPVTAQAQLLDSVLAWSESAIADIEDKRASLMGPLDKEEKTLLASVEEAFRRAERGNAAITAHLNSIRKVQQVEGEFMKALGIKDMREEIMKTLADSSNRARNALEGVQRTDNLLDKFRNQISR